jgi:Phytanoyl-CoA dioxygenase (PhyH)
MSDARTLLTDDEVISFVIRGYHVVEPDFPAGFNEAIYAELGQLGENPGDAILDRVPKLYQVYDHPKVRGALASLLGPDFTMNSHRHCHVNPPGTRSQSWHQDGTNKRHHQVQTVLAMYYPQDVPAELGPTVIMPGTHFRNAPTDRMATYANFREQVLLTVKAGTVAITHYDIWHAATANRGDRTRYMLKFLFTRAGEPAAPSWDHDADRAAAARRRLTFEKACACSQSDHYKERRLRTEMWQHLIGRAEGGGAERRA